MRNKEGEHEAFGWRIRGGGDAGGWRECGTTGARFRPEPHDGLSGLPDCIHGMYADGANTGGSGGMPHDRGHLSSDLHCFVKQHNVPYGH